MGLKNNESREISLLSNDRSTFCCRDEGDGYHFVDAPVELHKFVPVQDILSHGALAIEKQSEIDKATQRSATTAASTKEQKAKEKEAWTENCSTT